MILLVQVWVDLCTRRRRFGFGICHCSHNCPFLAPVCLSTLCSIFPHHFSPCTGVVCLGWLCFSASLCGKATSFLPAAFVLYLPLPPLLQNILASMCSSCSSFKYDWAKCVIAAVFLIDYPFILVCNVFRVTFYCHVFFRLSTHLREFLSIALLIKGPYSHHPIGIPRPRNSLYMWLILYIYDSFCINDSQESYVTYIHQMNFAGKVILYNLADFDVQCMWKWIP